jgi:hypothetical protein
MKSDEGHSVWLGGMGVVFKLSGAGTGGAFAIVEHPLEPGRLVLPHVHRHEDENSYVLEATIGARVGDHEVAAIGPGSCLLKPRGRGCTRFGTPACARPLEQGRPHKQPLRRIRSTRRSRLCDALQAKPPGGRF